MHLNFNSPIQLIKIDNHKIYIKRDDLISRTLSGNKARKLHYYIEKEFLHVDTLVSYGGIQSNMMYALSFLAKVRNWQFIYYTRFIPQQVKNLEIGNYFSAIKNGMKVNELRGDYDNIISAINTLKMNKTQLIIHQGGHQLESQYGINILAQELITWAKGNFLKNFNVFLPSGTGTSALYLQQALKPHVVYTTNCVGSAQYLSKQFFDLSLNINDHPQILENDRFRFAEPNKELLDIFNILQIQTNIEFDLIYDPIGWYFLLKNFHKLPPCPTVYIHCGGTMGNSTQILRYKYLKGASIN